MRTFHRPVLALACIAILFTSSRLVAGQIQGEIRSVDRAGSRVLVFDEGTGKEIQVDLSRLMTLPRSHGSKIVKWEDLRPGVKIVIDEGVVASRLEVRNGTPKPRGPMLQEFWNNFRQNLFKPLLLFFYLGFLVPILKVEFEFPYTVYQGLTIYLLLAIGWHGGEELAREVLKDPTTIGGMVGFMLTGFLVNSALGVAAYGLLGAMTPMRRIDRATVAGYYGSDSAGTFATCVGVLATIGMAFDPYMPVMLAVMEIPGCLVALYLVARLRSRGMDALGNLPDEPGYDARAAPVATLVAAGDGHAASPRDRAIEQELELSLEKREHPEPQELAIQKGHSIFNKKLLHEVFLNTGLYLLFGGIAIGLISGLQGEKVTRDDDNFFVTLFQGMLCLFLLEMGMTASRKIKDLKEAGWGFIAFGLLAPNLFATFGICVAHLYAYITHTPFEPGTYILFAVLCGAASYIAVPAVQRLAIPEASPTLPLAASLGLTFSYNVTIGIPVYIEIANLIRERFPIG